MRFRDEDLHVGRHDGEWRTAEPGRVERADEIAQAERAVERLAGPGHAGLREQRREQAIAHAIRLGDPLPHGKLPAPGRAERQVGGHGERDRVHHAGAVEAQNLAGRDRARDSRVERMIEAPRHHAQRFVQRAMDLVAGNDRRDRVAPIGAGDLRRRQHRRNHAARVSAAAREAVVAVEVARHRGIGEGRELRQRATGGAEHARALRDLGAQRDRPRDAARLRVERRDRARERIGDAPLARVHGLGRQRREGEIGYVVGDRAGRGVRVRMSVHRGACYRPRNPRQSDRKHRPVHALSL